MVCITDSFGRADAMDADIGDTESPAYPWEPHSERSAEDEGGNFWRIVDNHLYLAVTWPSGSPATPSEYPLIAIVAQDLASPNMMVTTGGMVRGIGEVLDSVGCIGPAGRISDEDNFWGVQIGAIPSETTVANYIALVKAEAGVTVVMAEADGVEIAIDTDTVTLAFSGDVIGVYLNDTLLFTYEDSFNNTALRAGVWSESAGDWYDTGVGSFAACVSGGPPLAGVRGFVAMV